MNTYVNHLDAFRPITDTDVENGLIIRWAGHYFCDKNSALNRVHNKYYLIYVYQGKGYMRNVLNNNEPEPVEAGSIILFKPGELQCFWADKEEPFSYYGTCFCGRVIDSLLEGSLACSATHHRANLDRRLVSMMNVFLNLMLLNRGSYDEMLLVSKFFEILARVNTVIELSQQRKAEQKSAESTIDFVAQYLWLNYNKKITINTLSEVSRYSVTWLEHHFKQKYGMTPLQYLANIRIKKAQHLLCAAEGEQFNIAEISYAVGFNDPFYFSKAFKKVTNLSPKDYRILNKSDPSC
ncbi:MAG: AraC family transcriptional regulator [Bacillota bacterium]